MTLFTRFGDRIELVRAASLADVKAYEKRKADKIDRERTRDGWRAIAKYCDIISGVGKDEKEILVDAGYLRADDGWREISKAFEALQPKSNDAVTR